MSKIIELCPSVLCNGAEYETDFFKSHTGHNKVH